MGVEGRTQTEPPTSLQGGGAEAHRGGRDHDLSQPEAGLGRGLPALSHWVYWISEKLRPAPRPATKAAPLQLQCQSAWQPAPRY